MLLAEKPSSRERGSRSGPCWRASRRVQQPPRCRTISRRSPRRMSAPLSRSPQLRRRRICQSRRPTCSEDQARREPADRAGTTACKPWARGPYRAGRGYRWIGRRYRVARGTSGRPIPGDPGSRLLGRPQVRARDPPRSAAGPATAAWSHRLAGEGRESVSDGSGPTHPSGSVTACRRPGRWQETDSPHGSRTRSGARMSIGRVDCWAVRSLICYDDGTDGSRVAGIYRRFRWHRRFACASHAHQLGNALRMMGSWPEALSRP